MIKVKIEDTKYPEHNQEVETEKLILQTDKGMHVMGMFSINDYLQNTLNSLLNSYLDIHEIDHDITTDEFIEEILFNFYIYIKEMGLADIDMDSENMIDMEDEEGNKYKLDKVAYEIQKIKHDLGIK